MVATCTGTRSKVASHAVTYSIILAKSASTSNSASECFVEKGQSVCSLSETIYRHYHTIMLVGGTDRSYLSAVSENQALVFVTVTQARAEQHGAARSNSPSDTVV